MCRLYHQTEAQHFDSSPDHIAGRIVAIALPMPYIIVSSSSSILHSTTNLQTKCALDPAPPSQVGAGPLWGGS
jgi:hypothetical protein